MKKAVFHSIMVLVLVLGLTISMAVPVMAQVGVEKDAIPGTGHPVDVYLVYQNVSYNLTLINNTDLDGQIQLIRDRFALGTIAVEDKWWNDDTKSWDNADPGLSFAFLAGAAWVEEVTHTIRPEHLIDHPTIVDAKGVTNQLRYEAVINGLPYDNNFPKTVQVIQPAIELEKSVTPGVAQVGQTVEYTFTITNTGDWPLEDITLIDDELGDLTGELPADLVLAVHVIGEEDHYHMFTYEYTIQAGDLPLTNEATVEAVAQDFSRTEFPYADPEDELPTAVVRDTSSARVTALHPVGGTASPVSRLALLAPWIVLAGLMAGAAVFVWSRRAQGRA